MNSPLKQAVEALRDAYHIRKWSKEPISKAGVEATPEEIEAVLAPYFGVTELLSKLSTEGGAIVSSDACTPLEIEHARRCGRLFVLEDGLGFILLPKRWLEIAKPAVERITKDNMVKSVMYTEENFHTGGPQ